MMRELWIRDGLKGNKEEYAVKNMIKLFFTYPFGINRNTEEESQILSERVDKELNKKI